jgi:hypothetical protein
LILGAVNLETSALLSFLGTLLGVAIAILFGVMFVKGSVRVNLQKFFRVTTVILFFVALQLLVSGLHELSENGVLPSSKHEMAIIGPIVRNDLFFFVTILALAALMILFEMKRRQPAVLEGSAAARRKAAWSARRERLWMASVYASSFVFIAGDGAVYLCETTSQLSPATSISSSVRSYIPCRRFGWGPASLFCRIKWWKFVSGSKPMEKCHVLRPAEAEQLVYNRPASFTKTAPPVNHGRNGWRLQPGPPPKSLGAVIIQG